MLKKYFILLLLLLVVKMYSQIIVNYDDSSTMIFDKKQSIDTQKMADHFKQPIPFILEINDSVSLYKKIEKITNQQESNHFFVVGGTSENIIYINFEKKTQTEQLSVENKNFLIKDSLIQYQWKLTKDSDQLLGFNVNRAYFEQDKNILVEAWYAKELPFRTGPELYSGLPGLILKLKITYKDQSNSYKLLEAKKIDLGKPKKINIPTKGMVVSREEFKKIYDEYIDKIKQTIIMKEN